MQVCWLCAFGINSQVADSYLPPIFVSIPFGYFDMPTESNKRFFNMFETQKCKSYVIIQVKRILFFKCLSTCIITFGVCVRVPNTLKKSLELEGFDTKKFPNFFLKKSKYIKQGKKNTCFLVDCKSSRSGKGCCICYVICD